MDGPKAVAFDNNNAANTDGVGNGTVVTKPKSRSGSIIGAISPIMGTGNETHGHIPVLIRILDIKEHLI